MDIPINVVRVGMRAFVVDRQLDAAAIRSRDAITEARPRQLVDKVREPLRPKGGQILNFEPSNNLPLDRKRQSEVRQQLQRPRAGSYKGFGGGNRASIGLNGDIPVTRLDRLDHRHWHDSGPKLLSARCRSRNRPLPPPGTRLLFHHTYLPVGKPVTWVAALHVHFIEQAMLEPVEPGAFQDAAHQLPLWSADHQTAGHREQVDPCLRFKLTP